MPALPLTAEQKEDAARLKRLFLSWKEARKASGEPASQDAFSDQVGFGQSAVNQYLNGKIPLNAHAAAKFSKALGCQISDFSESVAAIASEIGDAVITASDDVQPVARMSITELSKQEIHLVLTLRELGPVAREELIAAANRLYRLASQPPENNSPPTRRTQSSSGQKSKKSKTEKAGAN